MYIDCARLAPYDWGPPIIAPQSKIRAWIISASGFALLIKPYALSIGVMAVAAVSRCSPNKPAHVPARKESVHELSHGTVMFMQPHQIPGATRQTASAWGGLYGDRLTLCAVQKELTPLKSKNDSIRCDDKMTKELRFSDGATRVYRSWTGVDALERIFKAERGPLKEHVRAAIDAQRAHRRGGKGLVDLRRRQGDAGEP
jgi:hypothetical protein